MKTLTIKPLTITDIEKFARQFTIQTSGCWAWGRAINRKGYGIFFLHGRTYRAHRVGYAIKHNGLNSSLVIDHLCRNTACVNPNHLELVTNRENVMRGNLPKISSARLLQRTHCKSGHEFTVINTNHTAYKKKAGGTGAMRRCKTCVASYNRKHYLKRTGASSE